MVMKQTTLDKAAAAHALLVAGISRADVSAIYGCKTATLRRWTLLVEGPSAPDPRRPEIQTLKYLCENLPVQIKQNLSIGDIRGIFRPDMIIKPIDVDFPRSIIIEVDENQHKTYSKDGEKIRQNKIAQYIGKTIFIRFNPDKYHDGVVEDMCASMDFRLCCLLERIKFHLAHNVFALDSNQNEETVTEFLYYDSYYKF